ncbi:uncharacterized protein LOC120272557 [Dioscorea cayenensis subsp. rotundata]|uniref:Uncharacterized protein LOC120272557 n=1 Tax=Dioscorea cayennensis subsp. rotundata TaxID=55577 RepID=A0AB40C6V6_DIOCR|nr:uncharacterized protein LOC120272557 [Dioscorea cayenensis subsp. rotundata]
MAKRQPIPKKIRREIEVGTQVSVPESTRWFKKVWRSDRVPNDSLTKSAHFLAVKTGMSLEKLAEVYIDQIMRLHGVPVSTVSDRDTRFVCERTIQILEDMLRACMLDFGGSWDRHLPLIEFAYNNSYHASIQMAPYEKSYANNRRRILEFKVGDNVFLRVAPTKGVIRFGIRGKLSPRFIGPFEILESIGEVAYRLALPPALSRMHNMFHVSMLKKFIANPNHVIQFSDFELNNDITYEERPVKIVDFKEQVLRRPIIPYIKVQWSNHLEREATWELESEMRERYPYRFHLIR